MLPRKKLEYYAKQYGVENIARLKLTDEDCERICKKVGIRVIPAKDIGGDINVLISVVMDDPGFIDRHRSAGVSEDMILIRCGDYAAKEVFEAFVTDPVK